MAELSSRSPGPMGKERRKAVQKTSEPSILNHLRGLEQIRTNTTMRFQHSKQNLFVPVTESLGVRSVGAKPDGPQLKISTVSNGVY